MITNLWKLVFSFMLTGWIYAEAVLFFPPVKHLGDQFVQVVRIPTHDEWGDIARSDTAAVLSSDIDYALSGIGASGVQSFFYRYIGRFIDRGESGRTGQHLVAGRSEGWSSFSNTSFFEISESSPSFFENVTWF